MARRKRARENPGAGFWIAAGVGAVAVGGVIYVMTRPSTASASTTPQPQPQQIHPPLNDAATFRAPVTLSATINGRAWTEQHVPNPADLSNDLAHAHQLATIGHGAGKEGEVWSARAVADGASQAELAQLRSDGYAV